jgi:hypothetical protein
MTAASVAWLYELTRVIHLDFACNVFIAYFNLIFNIFENADIISCQVLIRPSVIPDS